LSPLLRGPGLVNLLRDCDAETIVTCPSFAPTLDQVREELASSKPQYLITDTEQRAGYLSYSELTARASDREPPYVHIGPDTPYNIIYSSGTTGVPKGIVHTHLVRAMYCTLFSAAFRIHPESVILHAGSIVFNGAFLTLMPAMFVGAKYVLLPGFDARSFINTVYRERVTHVMMVPSQIVALLSSPHFSAEALASLEMIGTVGAPLHLEHKQQLVRALPKRFYELYGLTEGFVTILDKHDSPRKLASVGTPPAFFEMRIVNSEGADLPAGQTGEIVGRGPILMRGYYKQPQLTREAMQDGWLHTGDLGYLDEDGFLYLVDRKKDLIISGGINVFPRDIEEIAVQHPEVREVAVFGIPHQRWGETAAAAIILRSAGSTTGEELRSWINQRVPAKFQR
ncbi:MAG: long-chain fatty acid--CoA ligase, partial [Acidobacteriales bacterium]|nr:long-chain fatty acid--CoA ligase [Terriglobales bacterium]